MFDDLTWLGIEMNGWRGGCGFVMKAIARRKRKYTISALKYPSLVS